jgi:hypothetical protein
MEISEVIKRLLVLLLLARPALAVSVVLNSFNAGELSPLLEGRTDVQKYYSGCKTLENMVVLPQGGVRKRPGSYYIASAKSNSAVCRLIPFEYSTTQAYIIELGNLYMRFYKDGGQITSGGSAYEITTPYVTADLFELQFAQSADTMYIVHADYQPRKLTRSGHTSWTLTAVAFERGPFLPENTTTTTITPSATTGTATLTASSSIFASTHVGAHWRVTHTVDGAAVSGSFAATGQSSSATVRQGQSYDFTTHGTWSGTLKLQRSYDSGSTWKDVLVYSGQFDRNGTYADTEDIDDAIYRVNCTGYAGTSSAHHIKYNLIVHSFDVDGVVEITTYTSPTVVTGTVENDLGGTSATKYWAEGAWSDNEGWPQCIAFYEERQAFAATTNSPQTVWLTQTDDWDNMLAGTDDTDAMSLTIASDQVNVIRWLSPQTALVIGTTAAEWSLSASNANEPLTPANISAKRQSSYGCAQVQAVVFNDTILYLQRQDRKVRRLQYDWASDSWRAADVTVLSEHITGDGITQMAYQRNPYPILWCVRDDGALAGMTMEEDQTVTGWHRHEFGGDVESVAVVPGADEDEVWIAIERTINGSTVRYIEQLQPYDYGDQEDAFFVDSGLTYDGGAAVTITGITQANPAVVTAAAHGLSDGDQVRISSVVGMTELNNNVYTVDDAATNTFSLDDADSVGNIDSTGFTAYSSGGSVIQVENTFSTLAHLGNETVAVLGDGGYYGTATVNSAGRVVLNDYFNTVHAGLAFTGKVQTMKLSSKGAPDALFAANKRITQVTTRFHDTLACDVGTSWTDYSSYIFRDADDPLETAPPLYTGDKELDYEGDYETDGYIYLQSRLPTPLTLLALKADVEVSRR